MKKTISIFALLLLKCFVPTVQSAYILETAPQGTTNGGTSISSNQFLGARFAITETSLITGIGGHLKSSSEVGYDRSIFIALVPTEAPDYFPSDISLSNAIFTSVFDAPYNDVGPYPYQVDDTLISTNIILAPGNYALVAGSGLFGATGKGWMPVSGNTQNLPWFFYMNRLIGDYFRNIDEQPIRFLVEGTPVPEPNTILLLVCGTLLSRKKR